MQTQYKKLVALVAVLVIGVVIGVAVYPPPKAARAELQYSVYTYYLNNQVPTSISDAGIYFRFKHNGNWGNWTPGVCVNGTTTLTDANGPADEWQIKITNSDVYSGVDPWGGLTGYPPVTQNSVSWQLCFPM